MTWRLFTGACLTVSVCGSVVCTLLGKASKPGTQLRTILSLAVLGMLIGGVLTFLPDNTEFMFADGGYAAGTYFETETEKTIAAAADSVGKALALYLTRKTGVATDAMEISLSLDTEDIQSIEITEVELRLYGAENAIAGGNLKALTEALLLCPCEVIYCMETKDAETEEDAR